MPALVNVRLQYEYRLHQQLDTVRWRVVQQHLRDRISCFACHRGNSLSSR